MGLLPSSAGHQILPHLQGHAAGLQVIMPRIISLSILLNEPPTFRGSKSPQLSPGAALWLPSLPKAPHQQARPWGNISKTHKHPHRSDRTLS